MKEFIEHQLSVKSFSEPMEDALHLILEDKMKPFLLTRVMNEHHINVTDLQTESIPFVFDYIKVCLMDDVITEEELRNAKMLKVFFKIREGELLRWDKNAIEELISRQLELIYADDVVDERESLAKVSLQDLFDLSYDQYLAFEHDAVKMALARGAELHRLDTFYTE